VTRRHLLPSVPLSDWAPYTSPRGLGTLAPSGLTRLKSSRPAPCNSANNSKCSWCHTPAACHSRGRRQHVMPLPKPSY